MTGFKNFLMQGQLVVVAVGLSIALAFSVLVQTFTGTIITPLVNAAGGGGPDGLGVRVNGQLLDFGSLISAVIYFIVFVAVVYFAIVVPYRSLPAEAGRRRLHRAATDQGLPGVPLRRPAARSHEVPVLRDRADGRGERRSRRARLGSRTARRRSRAGPRSRPARARPPIRITSACSTSRSTPLRLPVAR